MNKYNPSEFTRILTKSVFKHFTQLKVLSLRFCPQVGDEVLEAIAEHANPFYLKELYLDGCEKVQDEGLLKLVAPLKKKKMHLNHRVKACLEDMEIRVFKNE